MTIKRRKKEHVDLSISDQAEYEKATGFEQFDFVHNALPEVDFADVGTEASLLGKTFAFPLFISSMTGGYTEAGAVNAIIAEFCEDNNLPMGVGSQRVMLEHPEETQSFSIVREKAPSAFIAANIGGAQLTGGMPTGDVERLVSSIEADAVIVHLNPLQELMQPEGDRNFKGIEQGIAQLVEDSPVPVIAKETGAGFSESAARRLLDAGVSVLDIAGAGGTSWSKIENRRKSNTDPDRSFDEWGIPTVKSLMEVHGLKDDHSFECIVSGGIRGPFDIVKSLCLGGDFTASARPVIRAVTGGGREALQEMYEIWRYRTRVIMTLLGCQATDQLDRRHLYFI